MEAAAVRPSVQVGGPPPGQRASDPGPPTQQSQPPPPTLAYQQRISSGASPIHRPVDTPQPYTKGGIGPPPSQQPTSRSAASPLSPPRPGGAVNHTAYPRFSDVTATSLRYVPQTQYGVGQVQTFRENPYARISQVPASIQEYHRPAGGQPIVTGNSNMSLVSVGSTSTMEASAQGHSSGRQRMSLISAPQHATEYMSNTRPPPQAPPDPGGQPFKKIRLGETNHSPAQQLKVDTREHRPATTEAYHPQVEAISPTLPNDTVEERRTTKDDLLMQINKVDNEITKAENAKAILKNKEKALEEASAKPSKEPEPSEAPIRHRSLAQKIYAENRKRAAEEHAVLNHLGPQHELPLYNQPSDVEICQEIIQRHQSIKSRLILHLRRLKSEKAAKNAALVEKYSQLSQEWLKRVEKIESSAKRKAKEAKNREFFEKVFTELRKQREDKERFNRVGSRIKSEADLEEIMDGLQEQAMEDKKMRSYAVIPPLMYDARQRRNYYSNENGFLPDMVANYKESQNINVWTAGEKEIFKEKFLQHPKNFGAIAASLDRKSAQDCVRYYYLSKKTENYKQLLRKSRQRTRSSRNPQKAQQAQAQCIVDSLTTGVTTRLQREQQQKTGGRDRAAHSTAVSTVSGAAGATAGSSTASTTTGGVGVAATSGLASAVASTSSSSSTVQSPTTAGSTVNSGSATVTTVASTAVSGTTTTTAATTTTAIKNEEEGASASSGLNETSSQSMNGPNSGASTDTNKEQLTSSTNSSENVLNSEQQPASSEGAFIAASKDSMNTPSGTSTTGSSNGNSNCNAVLNSGTPSATETSSATATSGNANSLGATTATVPTFNGLKTELVITNVVNLNDGKSLCNDKERKSPAVGVTASGGDDKSNLNNGGRTRPRSADSCDASEPKKTRLDSDSSSNQTSLLPNNEKTPEANAADSKDKFHPCFVCKTESCPRTRPLKKGRGQQYGISDDTIPAGARVCNSCQCKSVRNRYPNCPLPTCPNSKDRAKNNIPSRLYELAPEIRDAILQEFQIPPNATKCCSACLMRIRRKLDPHSTLTDDERRTMLTDGDESDLSTSSCDERDAASSDTASAESPNNPLRPSISQKDDSQTSDPTIVPLSRKASSFEDDRLLPPLGQAPRKQKTAEEYDSSATETADEENENSPANRQSPKSMLHVNQGGVAAMVPPSNLQNGPQRDQPNDQQTNVQEIVYNVIEFHVKTKPKQPILNDSRDVAFVREYRNDNVSKPATTSASLPASMQSVAQVAQQIPQTRQLQLQPQSQSGPAESLATLSVVNSQSHMPQQIISHPHGLTATITPVKPPMQQSQAPPPPSQIQQQSGVIAHEIAKDEIIYGSRNEPEPQTLDLSIKKSSTRDNISVHTPVSHAKVQQQQQHSGSMPMYRNELANNSAYLAYHQVDMNRPTKPRSIYVSQVPAPAPPLQPNIGIQHQQSQMQVKQKVTPKLSPKIHQQSPSPSQMMSAGPKGSITHGTPVNSQQQQMLIQSATALSPRYENLPRQTPPGPDGNKLGSITQGTPVHHIHDKQRVYFEYKANRQSPAQQGPPPPQAQPQPPPQPPQSSPQTQSFMSSPYGRSYALEQTQQLSSRQIVMHDYITSQQMHGQHCRQGRNDKESQSPRTMMYFTEKDRARSEFLSRTSPAEHINSTSSPHRTPPPPQRQGVIQRHNTGGSKPPSPSPNRHPIMQHYPSAGHEAFSSFVEVAVQQPQLPVPKTDDKRAVLMPVGEHQGPSPHYDMRYQMTPEQQMHHLRQQQQAAAAADMQRRIYAQQERDHRERQERENAERQNQERLQAERDRIEREREREMERERDRDRERLRMEEREREERKRESARGMPTSVMGAYMRNMPPAVNRMPEKEREAIRRTQPGLQPFEISSSTIIDAIIQSSIKGTSEPPSRRDLPGRQYYAARDQPHSSSISVSENNGKSSSPNVINVELDGDRGRKQEVGTITLGELTDSIIAKDFGPNPTLSRGGPYMMPTMQEPIVTTDQWHRRRMQQKEAEQAAAERNKSASHGRSGTPDERQIIRMAQPQSPRNKFSIMPQSHYYSTVHGAPPPPVASSSPIDRRMGGGAPSHQVAFDCYVKNRIVEAMRTEDDRRPSDDGHMQGHHDQQDGLRQVGGYAREMDGRPNSGSGMGGNSTPVNYEDDRRSMSNSSSGMPMTPNNDSSHGPLQCPPHQGQQSAPVTTFASTTCAYPYNILNVSGPPPPSSKKVDSGVPPPPPQQAIAEPKPLLVPHYEALSDED